MGNGNDDGSVKSENETESEIVIDNTVISVCRLCLQLSNLIPLTSSKFAKEFNNFNFIQVEIDCKFPENICTECIGILDQIGLFLKTCQNSYHIYNRTEEIEDKINIIENEILPETEMKEEEIESDCEVALLLPEDPEILSTEIYDATVENAVNKEQDSSKCEEINPTEIVWKDNSKDDKRRKDSDQMKLCHTCGACVPKLGDHYQKRRSCLPRSFSCPICKRYFSTKKKLVDHHSLHHSNGEAIKLFKCEMCLKEFKYEQNLRRHVLVHKFGKRFICEICGKRFTTNSLLNEHKNVHTQTMPFSCKLCGKSFYARAALFSHQRVHMKRDRKPRTHVVVPKNEHFCSICNRKFSNIGPLKVHLKSHEENRKYLCKKCNIEFETSQLCREHCKIHKPKKQVDCPHCRKSFTDRPQMEIHARIHTGERPYMCSLCGKTFRITAHLHTHMMVIHSINRGKPFECKFCKKTFLFKDRLVFHERIHTGERPFKCHVCDKGFTDRGTRKKHVKKVHGEGELENIL